MTTASAAALDPITFAVVKSALDTIVDDMAFTVMRTARSPIVRDVLDYSTTLCDADGQIVAQAKTVALHLGAVPDAIEEVLRLYRDDMNPGDVVIMNDPYAGGMHLPDIFMFKPAFPGGPPTMFICGNDDAAKTTVRGILSDFGWEAEDIGKVEGARAIEPLCQLWCAPGFQRNQWTHAFKLLKL